MPWAAFLLATPIFGLSYQLNAPLVETAPLMEMETAPMERAWTHPSPVRLDTFELSLGAVALEEGGGEITAAAEEAGATDVASAGAEEPDDEAPAEEAAATAAEAPVAVSAEDAAAAEAAVSSTEESTEESAEERAERAAEASPGSAEGVNIGEAMARRARLAKIHKIFGITTWVSMLGTSVLGMLQYYNLYGFFGSREDTPCVSGHPIFGESSCIRQPIPHLVSSLLTTTLYSVTFGLSVAMPDPIGLDQGQSSYASRLRTHKVLRWVHFSGMIAQMLLGIFVANAHRFGITRDEDFGVLQALGTVHMGLGLVTFGALTWAGTLFLF